MKTIKILLVTAIAFLVFFSCQREIELTPTQQPPPPPPPVDTLVRIISFSPDSVKVGDTVTIKGKKFVSAIAANQVTVNGTAATVLSVNDSTIIFQVGAGTTTGKITLTSGWQTVTTTTDLRIYTVAIMPWVQKADFPELLGSSFSINGLAMTFNSATSGYIYKTKKLWQYDPAANTWTRKTDIPSARFHNNGLCFTIGNKAYIGLGSSREGGQPNSMSKEVWEYDIPTDVWTKKADFPGPRRAACFSFSVGNFGYVGGGDTASANFNPAKDVWRYDPQTDSWTKMADYPGTKVTGLMGFNLQSTGYVFESSYGTLAAPLSAITQFKLWSYDPQTNSWTQKASLNMTAGKPATSATVFALNGKGYAALGGTDTTNTGRQLTKKDFWEYNPQSDVWTAKPQVGGPVRYFPSSFAINGKGYVGMGTGIVAVQKLSDFWQWNP